MVLDEHAYTLRWFMATHEVVLCIRFRFDRGAVAAHVQATGIIAYEGVDYRLHASPSIEFRMSVKCRVDFGNVRAQYSDIVLEMEKPV
jgi:hypothetical protein